MLLTLLLLVIFLAVGGLMWFQGIWNNVVTLVLLLLSGMVATNYYEPIAAYAVKQEQSYSYLYDILIFWGLFSITFTLLRVIADQLSHERVQFIKPVELAGRSVLAVIVAYVFVCLAAFSLHMAPIQANAFNGAYKSPSSGTFLFLRPGQQWASFMSGWSGGSLKDRDRRFPGGVEFASKYYQRRKNFESVEGYRN